MYTNKMSESNRTISATIANIDMMCATVSVMSETFKSMVDKVTRLEDMVDNDISALEVLRLSCNNEEEKERINKQLRTYHKIKTDIINFFNH